MYTSLLVYRENQPKTLNFHLKIPRQRNVHKILLHCWTIPVWNKSMCVGTGRCNILLLRILAFNFTGSHCTINLWCLETLKDTLLSFFFCCCSFSQQVEQNWCQNDTTKSSSEIKRISFQPRDPSDYVFSDFCKKFFKTIVPFRKHQHQQTNNKL